MVIHQQEPGSFLHVDGLMQKRPNSSVSAVELHLFHIKTSMYTLQHIYNILADCSLKQL